ncbi:MFS transporter [Plantactinospora endophytica]|uniref:Tetracycline efflux MFS transporter Tet(V) n=1 Tax=Plantactinospora endophytica TaxID=673535 RepID=A0ABQ4E1S2_9ACTN|nr:MFS transporter [Plantactinospora endophytica]GIG88659.1 tetracycline efflux MFS transporter Tet(V) [Plantactinospora endophytica]
MTGSRDEQGPGWLRGPLRPFRSGQYQLLAGALTMSLFAAGVWMIAVVWQIIEMGGGPGELSFVSAAAAAGMLATTLLGGVLADRVPQRRILLLVAGVRSVTVGLVAALALTDRLQLWQLAAVSLLIGVGNGFHYPAYSALLPSILSPEDLLPANGVEGMLRPTIMQAAGPALASVLVAAWSPGAALLVVTVLEVAGVLFLVALRPVPLRHDRAAPAAHPIRSTLTDLRDGFVYMGRTPWLLATLLYASVLILLIMGPIEVLIPFVVKDRAGGGPGDHALVMAAFGVGGAIGSLGMAAFRMPRRYLTVMNLFWGLGCLPLAVVGVAGQVWVIAVAVFAVGICFSAPMVIWGTLLQRRVPPHMLGRVSSLDFFVSLVFMPVSMAVAGPVSTGIGLGATFALAGLLPALLAILAIGLARMPQDELAHPLDPPAEPADPPTSADGPADPPASAEGPVEPPVSAEGPADSAASGEGQTVPVGPEPAVRV